VVGGMPPRAIVWPGRVHNNQLMAGSFRSLPSHVEGAAGAGVGGATDCAKRAIEPWRTVPVGARVRQAGVVDVSEFEVRGTVDAARLPQLMELFGSAWWTDGRTAGDVRRMLAASDLLFALVHRPSGRLAGFARVITDEVYIAVVLDVVVAPESRGAGLGAMLLDAIVGHPRLAGVRSIELVCQPDLVPFYRRWGFTERVGRSRLMRRTADPLLR